MTYGITGNPAKDALWQPLSDLVDALAAEGLPFRLAEPLAAGLRDRGLSAHAMAHATDTPADGADFLLSFGGDGTIEAIEAGRTGVEERMTLDVEVDAPDLGDTPTWALNDVVVDKSGTTSMIQVEATVNGAFLNTYWADGLVVATPTGSTAYALSVGGPILVPGSETIVVAPIAPHTLTARPIVLPCNAELVLRVETRGHPFAFACDGVSTLLDGGVTVRIRRSEHVVRLVTLPDRDYFRTIRSKLSWGQGGVF